MRLGTCQVTIHGLSPLLMHSSKGMKHRSERSDQQGPMKAAEREYETVEQEAEAGAYRRADGVLFIPGSAVREALVTACQGYDITVEGKTRKQPLWKIMAATVFLPQMEVPLSRGGELIREYEIDQRRVVVSRSGVVRARPVVPLPWQADIDIEFDAGQWRDPAAIIDMLNNAGRFPGLLEFRPEKGGTFGRFEARMKEDHSNGTK